MPGTESAERRLDIEALLDIRASGVLLVTLAALSAPVICYFFQSETEALDPIPKVRLLARVAALFLFFGVMNFVAVTTRIGVTTLTAFQHQFALRVHLLGAFLFSLVLALDFALLLALPNRLSIGDLRYDAGLSVLYLVSIPLTFRYQEWFFGFDSRVLKQACRSYQSMDLQSEFQDVQPIDTLDFRVLQLVAAAGGDPLKVMISTTGVGFQEMMHRLRKLCLVGYLEVRSEIHGANISLTVSGTDALALPVALFVWNSDDRELLRDLALARVALEGSQPQQVVVACARISERLLKGTLNRHVPDLEKIGHKPIGSATLGELVGACRQHKLFGKFDDYVFSAINERRKKIHDLQGDGAIDDNDAFLIYTLTEIAARSLSPSNGE